MTMPDPTDRYRSMDEALKDLHTIIRKTQAKRYLLITSSPNVNTILYNMGFIDINGTDLDPYNQEYKTKCKVFLSQEFQGNCKISLHMMRQDGRLISDGTYDNFGR